jgi:hypothetical protein
MALLACSEKLGVLFGDKTEGLEAKDHIGGIIVSVRLYSKESKLSMCSLTSDLRVHFCRWLD